MTDEQILKAAVEKAEDGGWRFEGSSPFSWDLRDDVIDIYNEDNDIESEDRLHRVVFSHDFAKAFWGEEVLRIATYNADTCENALIDSGDFKDVAVWQYHLQQLVLEQEPLKYLEKFLIKDE